MAATPARFPAWTRAGKRAVVSTALDQCLKFLHRKQEQMQTFHGERRGRATVNAWALTRNGWRFLQGAKRAGRCPLELAGANFLGLPWRQLVNLVRCAWPTLALAGAALLTST